MHSSASYIAKIADIQVINSKVKRFFLQFDFNVHYKSGQFIIIDFKDINHPFTTRSYSIADYARGNIIELCVVLKEDGAATPKLFDQKIGEQLFVSEPLGRFVLPEDYIDHQYVFICTGTGVAPFRAMIKELLIEKKHKKNIYLYFGGRTQNDLLYKNEFETLEQEYSNFKYHPVLSQESWDGAKGYVHQHYLTLAEQKIQALFYICGWSNMVKEARDNLKELGYTRNEIKIELYD